MKRDEDVQTILLGSGRRTMGATSAEAAERLSDVPLREVEVDENDIYAEVARMLKNNAYTADETIDLPRSIPEGVRENLHRQFRHVVADVIENPTQANFAAVGYCVQRLVMATLRETAVEHVARRMERE